MLELKDQEDSEPSMNQDMIRLLNYCCRHSLTWELTELGSPQEPCMMAKIYNGEEQVVVLDFSDFYYPKNLLRTLKEKLNND